MFWQGYCAKVTDHVLGGFHCTALHCRIGGAEGKKTKFVGISEKFLGNYNNICKFLGFVLYFWEFLGIHQNIWKISEIFGNSSQFM